MQMQRSCEVIDLDAIWDEKILENIMMKSVTKGIETVAGYTQRSWLIQSLDQDRMYVDVDCENILRERYQNSKSSNIEYYFGQMRCDCYSLFLAFYLSIKFPEKQWRVVYIPDHYFVMDLDDIINQRLSIYDICAFVRKKSGCKYWDIDFWNKYNWDIDHNLGITRNTGKDTLSSDYTSIKSVMEHFEMVLKRLYY